MPPKKHKSKARPLGVWYDGANEADTYTLSGELLAGAKKVVKKKKRKHHAPQEGGGDAAG